MTALARVTRRLPAPLRRVSWPLRTVGMRGVLLARMARTPALAGLTHLRVVERRNGITEFAADLPDGPATLLRITRDRPDRVARNIHFAHVNLAQHIDDPRYAVPEPLAVMPEIGVVALRRHDLPNLRAMIRAGHPATRDGLERGGAWLAALHDAFERRAGRLRCARPPRGDRQALPPLAKGARRHARPDRPRRRRRGGDDGPVWRSAR